jgi:hypothetical protein
MSYSDFQITAVQIELKKVGAIHELPLLFLCHTHLKIAISPKYLLLNGCLEVTTF